MNHDIICVKILKRARRASIYCNIPHTVYCRTEEGKSMPKDEASRYHTLLRDPARRKIIEILGEQGKSGFKDLRSSLGLGVGTVYYHLDMLSDFLVQEIAENTC